MFILDPISLPVKVEFSTCLCCDKIATYAPVAQLDRVLVSEAKGHWFESSRARHLATGIDSVQTKEHWEQVYTAKATDSVSWYQAHAEQSLRLIRGTGIPYSASIIDVGGGASTFAEDGPLQCSGLPVMRYSANALHAEFGTPFTLLKHEKEEHHTPLGAIQKFVYCYCRKSGS